METAAESVTAIRGRLPRLLVISDVAVERTGAGSLLLYRLFDEYPADRLRIFFQPAASRGPEVRLPRVTYSPLGYEFPRYLRNRLNPFWPVFAARRMRTHAVRISSALENFVPEAVLSVANGFLWFTAAAFAARSRIPLHLFVHEDWPTLVTANRPGWVWNLVRSAARATARPVYRQATSRFSVSRGMVEELNRSHGVSSTLIYPNRGADSPECAVRIRAERTGAPVVAHTGFVHLAGNAALLREVAGLIGPLGGHLDLYTMHNDSELAYHGLVPPVVRNVGFFPAREMTERVAATADLLLLTASFEDNDRQDVSTLFPSRLADYTAIGLPILIWGPNYSSAARWAAEHPGATELVVSRNAGLVENAIRRLVSDRAHANEVVRNGINAGKNSFELAVARDELWTALAGR
jgi:hypothetical protein